MLITERKESMVLKEVDKSIVCDGCGVMLHDYEIKVFSGEQTSYYSVSTHHYDWGNDSCDSLERFDYCEECLPKAFEKYYKMRNKGSECFDVEHETGRVNRLLTTL